MRNVGRSDIRGRVLVSVRGGKSHTRTANRRAIVESAMKNAKTSFEIEGHRYRQSDWSKIMHIASELESVI